jgi:hypothetical protein
VHLATLVDRFEAILPLAVQWAKEQERRIMDEGEPLSADQIADARAVGVRQPEQVRLLAVEEIPAPPHPVVQAASAEMAFLPTAPCGLTLQYGIFLRSDRSGDRHLVVHELVHTSQYERLGGILLFLRDYLTQCATFGYHEAPLELEANALAERITNPQAQYPNWR